MMTEEKWARVREEYKLGPQLVRPGSHKRQIQPCHAHGCRCVRFTGFQVSPNLRHWHCVRCGCPAY